MFSYWSDPGLATHGSGVYIGWEGCLRYCVHGKTRKASPARKSLDDRRPATGRSLNPVHSEMGHWDGVKKEHALHTQTHTERHTDSGDSLTHPPAEGHCPRGIHSS